MVESEEKVLNPTKFRLWLAASRMAPVEFLQNAVARRKGCATYAVRFMSQHSSLRAAAGTTGAKRSVLKRFERVALLKTRGQWKTGDRVTGLRKTKPPE